MFNFFLLILHIAIVSSISLFTLRLCKEAVAMWLGLLAIAMNLFVLKQIPLLGLHVTASEALCVGYLLTLNLIQEFYGKKFARQMVKLTFFIMLFFVILSRIHLLYEGEPNHDLFSPLPRLYFASLVSFFTVQFFDISLFSFLRNKLSGRFLTIRTTVSLLLSQTLDTVLFTFIGLWGIVDNPGDVILFSLIIKSLIIFLNAPFVSISKRIVHV